MFPSSLDKVGSFIRDAIAPVFCVQCGQCGGWLCSACAEKIVLIKEQVCYRCGKLSDGGKTCQRCRRRTNLSGVMVAAHYEAGPVREMIHKLKYEGMTDLVGLISTIGLQCLTHQVWKSWTIIPIPLHISRLRQRGFNQAALLGQKMASKLGVLCQTKGLIRIKMTTPQAELTSSQRKINLDHAFATTTDFRGRLILLVDDVMTTGATLEDAARALKEVGAAQVWGMVIARG